MIYRTDFFSIISAKPKTFRSLTVKGSIIFSRSNGESMMKFPLSETTGPAMKCSSSQRGELLGEGPLPFFIAILNVAFGDPST